MSNNFKKVQENKMTKSKKKKDWVNILSYIVFGIIVLKFVLILNKDPSKLTLVNVFHLLLG